MAEEQSAKIIGELFAHGVLVNKEMLGKTVDDELVSRLDCEGDLLVLNDDYLQVIKQPSSLVDWYDIDKYRVVAERDRNDELYQRELQQTRHQRLSIETPTLAKNADSHSLEASLIDESEAEFFSTAIMPEPSAITAATAYFSTPLLSSAAVSVVIHYENTPRKFTAADFTRIFTSRYAFLEKLLRNRQELQQTLSISRIRQKKEREQVSLIGAIQDIGTTKNNNLIVKMEDPTGMLSVLFSRNKEELYAAAKELVCDEIVGIKGTIQGDLFYAEAIVWPDIPESHDLKKGPEEEYAIFLSDIHVGSKLFLREDFQRFLDWINCRAGNEQQRDIARKVKYIIIPGDAVDGVGIYPSQEEELEIKDITKQYDAFADLLEQIPSTIQIVLCPGNHDVVHLAEPQRAFSPRLSPRLFSIPNLTLVSNPALITIGKTATFSGFDILLYHGYSFDYFVANVDAIRNGGGYQRSDLIMKFLLKRRHLAPSFRSTPYFPGHQEDPLLIKQIPDFFATGHIHYCTVANYRGVTMISGSCWQDTTSFQEKLGHRPEPARVPIVNLKTRQVKILKFR